LRDDLSSNSDLEDKPQTMQRDNSSSRLSDRSAGSTGSKKKPNIPVDPKTQMSPRAQSQAAQEISPQK
jgi:hypothetical protein